ncbi:MAG: transcriptional regulator NrdR [Candidatus Moranbacteria bacterium RIFCSPHIGHO2_02_FULL_40_12b]|nr:MAG: transcriptional regulator NrdR [Candidatus Moranbacteria bacterium RIFCSPHIGHO2_02_FULL_40_12b]OGI24058.1 MAG: transcriptional regulator NrdR [Candidatus Moranbacteria bacterium RIFCSPHIGHO2_12_FULL_40_10]
MICPFCGHSETKVIDSRDTNDGKAIRRRRECEKCQARFSTYEEMEIMKMAVIKKDGRKQDYDRAKIEAGIKKALEKRPVKNEDIEKLLGDIEYEIHSKEACEITSKEIGKIVLEKLKEIDDVAYLRFASVYKSFGSAESFKKEAEKLSE